MMDLESETFILLNNVKSGYYIALTFLLGLWLLANYFP